MYSMAHIIRFPLWLCKRKKYVDRSHVIMHTGMNSICKVCNYIEGNNMLAFLKIALGAGGNFSN